MNPVRPSFTRTSCACPDDVANCKRRPGMLMPSDIEPITMAAMALGWISEPVDIRLYLRATPGAILGRRLTPEEMHAVSGQVSILTHLVPTISPATTDGHRCVFLTPDDRCQIHAVAPAGCAFFDMHMPTAESERRSLWIHQIIDGDVDYDVFRSTLRETP